MLVRLVEQYPILVTLTSWISARDVYHLALTSNSAANFILNDDLTVKKALLKDNTCIGVGTPFWPHQCERCNGKIPRTTKCSGVDLHPCQKCRVSVCTSCRSLEHICPDGSMPYHEAGTSPHYDDAYDLQNVIAYCNVCETEEEARADFTGKECECKAGKRWICRRCKHVENEEWGWYSEHWTAMYDGTHRHDEDINPQMRLHDHQFETLARDPLLLPQVAPANICSCGVHVGSPSQEVAMYVVCGVDDAFAILYHLERFIDEYLSS